MRKLLILDDKDYLLRSSARLLKDKWEVRLEHINYFTSEASEPAVMAMIVTAVRDSDAVLTDYDMGWLKGSTVAEICEESGTPCVVFSGDERRGLPCECLRKPADSSEINAALERAIAKKETP